MATLNYYGEMAELYGTNHQLYVEDIEELLNALQTREEWQYIQDIMDRGVALQLVIDGEMIDLKQPEQAVLSKPISNSTINLIPYYCGAIKWLERKVRYGARRLERGVRHKVKRIAGGIASKPLVRTLLTVAGASFGVVGKVAAGAILAYGNKVNNERQRKSALSQSGASISDHQANVGTAFSDLANNYNNGQAIPMVYGRVITGSVVVENNVKTTYKKKWNNYDKSIIYV